MNIFNPVFVTKGLSPEKLEQYKRRAWREFYLKLRVQLNLMCMLLKNPVIARYYVRSALEFVRSLISPPHTAEPQD